MCITLVQHVCNHVLLILFTLLTAGNQITRVKWSKRQPHFAIETKDLRKCVCLLLVSTCPVFYNIFIYSSYTILHKAAKLYVALHLHANCTSDWSSAFSFWQWLRDSSNSLEQKLFPAASLISWGADQSCRQYYHVIIILAVCFALGG